MTNKKRLYIALGTFIVVVLATLGTVTVYMWPHLPDKISFQDGKIVLFYLHPYPN